MNVSDFTRDDWRALGEVCESREKTYRSMATDFFCIGSEDVVAQCSTIAELWGQRAEGCFKKAEEEANSET